MQTITLPRVAPVSKFSQHPLKVVALGDSLVYGYGDPVGGGWVERLRRHWMLQEDAGHILYNLGIRGDRVFQVSERLEQEYKYRGEIRNRLPDYIILSVGTNDTPRLGRPDGRLFTDLATFQQQISQLLTQAKQLCPVLFVGMTPVDETKMPFLDCFYFSHADQYRFKEVTKQACEMIGIPYLDIFDLWMSRGGSWLEKQLSSDGLHPNVEGYQSLFEDVLNWQPMNQLQADLYQKI